MTDTTFIPESGLTTQNTHSELSTPKRTHQDITPPTILVAADNVTQEFHDLSASIDNDHPAKKYHSCMFIS